MLLSRGNRRWEISVGADRMAAVQSLGAGPGTRGLMAQASDGKLGGEEGAQKEVGV